MEQEVIETLRRLVREELRQIIREETGPLKQELAALRKDAAELIEGQKQMARKVDYLSGEVDEALVVFEELEQRFPETKPETVL